MLLDTPVCDFGWKAPSFELPDFDGKSYKLEDYCGDKGLLICFICNHCPYVLAIIDRLVHDAKILQNEGVGILAIMPNDYSFVPDDSPEKMKDFFVHHGMTFPYLVDDTQEVARAYGAVCTPDFFGFNADLELQYRGRLDDAKMKDTSHRNPELLNAMRQISQTGKGPQDQVPSMGCSIKWK